MSLISDVNCVYFNNANRGTCHKKFNRGKDCVLSTKPRCGHKKLHKVCNQTFDDPKWYWKSTMNTLMTAMSGLFYSEQAKFQNSKKGEAHADRRRKIGHYPFIMREMGGVMAMVIHVRKYFGSRTKTPKFIDCGCGVGNVVLMAHFAGFDAYGIEYDPVTLQRGRRLFKQFRVNPKKLFRGDILEYPNYADYDVIYCYCPMCNDEKEQAFENKVKLDMKVGALTCGLRDRNDNRIGKERAYFQRLILAADDYACSMVNPLIKMAHEKD